MGESWRISVTNLAYLANHFGSCSVPALLNGAGPVAVAQVVSNSRSGEKEKPSVDMFQPRYCHYEIVCFSKRLYSGITGLGGATPAVNVTGRHIWPEVIQDGCLRHLYIDRCAQLAPIVSRRTTEGRTELLLGALLQREWLTRKAVTSKEQRLCPDGKSHVLRWLSRPGISISQAGQ